LEWNLYLNALKPKGRLHFVGAITTPLDISMFPLMLGQREVSGSPVGSPATIETMLDFANLHNIKPQIECFPMSKINEAFTYLKTGDARYRIVLSND
jgi:uncharacterized zinc-type alcohol dehydrogenase-like protein